MKMYDIIEKKRDGSKLNKEEIDFFIEGYVSGEIPDYQISALLMAIFLNKMDKEETFNLTTAMKKSGDIIDLSQINGIKVDKHSTGGVGDKTTLIVTPIVASVGIPVAKMSGRGLGFTGGTVDKLASIPGFKTSLPKGEFMNLVDHNKISVIGQTGEIAVADKKIYALRDVTATVNNMSLIASSIMSKKLASGSDAIVLDVKCGKGAFMENEQDAEKLSSLMVEIGKQDGKKVAAVITDMNEPLGKAVGNSLEVIEAIDTLKGKGPEDIKTLSIVLAGIMIYLGGKARTIEEGKKLAEESIQNGSALNKFKTFIASQGGDMRVVEDYSLFKQAKYALEIIADKDGYIKSVFADIIGMASLYTGAGRSVKDEEIDLSAGVILHKKVGEKVKKGEKLATVLGNDLDKVNDGMHKCKKGFLIEKEEPYIEPLIKNIIGIA